MEVHTMDELIKEVPELVEKIEQATENLGSFYFTMYGSHKSTTSRIDEKYKSAIHGWCKHYGYRFDELHDFYHTFKISKIY